MTCGRLELLKASKASEAVQKGRALKGARGSRMAQPEQEAVGPRGQLAPPSAAKLEMLIFIHNKELHSSCPIYHPQVSTEVFTSSLPTMLDYHTFR